MFVIPNKSAAIHKAWLYRVLEAIADNSAIAAVLYFKGGTCASMLGWLDRFSVDLDFDYVGMKSDIPKVRKVLEIIFSTLGLSIKDASKNGIQYFLKYDNEPDTRNTLKIDVAFPIPRSNTYAPQRFIEIDRVLNCQTIETMFANKLVTVMERYKKNGEIAGRDIYDIHHFFMKGYSYSSEVIHDRVGLSSNEFFETLVAFIEKEVTDKIIIEDLGSLLTTKEFSGIRKILKREVLMIIRDEVGRAK